MMLDLSPVINYEGKVLEIETQLDFCDQDTGITFLTPVKVSGQIVNIGGSLELSACLSTKILYSCDRCCEEFEQDFECPVKEVLKKETQDLEQKDDSDAIYFQGSKIDFAEIVLNSIIVSLPSKILCKDDCQGLCEKCGKNLNLGDCDCDTRIADPRFDVLDKLL